eukprot:3615697-Rhodomonas_salina.1
MVEGTWCLADGAGGRKRDWALLRVGGASEGEMCGLGRGADGLGGPRSSRRVATIRVVACTNVKRVFVPAPFSSCTVKGSYGRGARKRGTRAGAARKNEE